MTKISDKRLAEMIVSAENHGEAGFSYVHTKDYIIALKELTALRAHNSDSAEPVAWRWRDPYGGWLCGDTKPTWPAEPLYLASPPAKEVIDDGRWKRIYDALAKEGGGTWATYMMIDIEALTNRTPDDEVGNG